MSAMVELDITSESTSNVLDFTLFQSRQAFNKLEEWLLSDEALGLPEHKVEIELEQCGREVWRLMLQAHLNQRGTGDVGGAIDVSYAEGEVTTQKLTRKDPNNIVSIFGEVKTQRTAYTAKGKQTVHPLDEQAQLPARSFSYEMQRRTADDAVRGSFDETIESIEKATGNLLSKRSAEQITVDAARDFDAFYDRRTNPQMATTGPIVVGQVDGKGVPMVKPKVYGVEPIVRRKKGEKANKKKMATVAAVYTQQPRVRTPEDVVESLFKEKQPSKAKDKRKSRPENKRVWASLEKSKDQVIEDMASEMDLRDPENSKLWVVLTDGERALQQRVKKETPCSLLILDFLHALERLWTSAHAFHGEGTESATKWVRDHALSVLQGKVSQVVKGMRQSVTKRGLSGEKRKKVLAAANYLYNNRERMRYHVYLDLGLPIATGTIEGACRHLVKDRMERSGMRWQIPGAEAILRLRAIKISGDMDNYWAFHIKQEQRRLYGQTTWKVAS